MKLNPYFFVLIQEKTKDSLRLIISFFSPLPIKARDLQGSDWKLTLAVITSQYQTHQCLRIIFIGLWCNHFLLCALRLRNWVVSISWAEQLWLEKEAKLIEIWIAHILSRAFSSQGRWIFPKEYNADSGFYVHDKTCDMTNEYLITLYSMCTVVCN